MLILYFKFKMFLTKITVPLFPQNTRSSSSLVWKVTPPFTQAQNLDTTVKLFFFTFSEPITL